MIAAMIARLVVVVLGLATLGGCGNGKRRPTPEDCVDCCTDGGSCDVETAGEAEDAGGAVRSDAAVPADLDAAPDDASPPEADGAQTALDGGFLALPEAEAWCAFQADRALATSLRALRCGAYPSTTTEAMVRAEVAARTCDYVPYELGTGTMRVHRENVLTCLRALAEESCSPVPGICYRDLVGTVPRGGACHMEVNTSVECAPGLHCDLSTSCPGVCVDDVPVGSSDPGRCSWGEAERVDGVCTALLGEGEPCDPRSGPSCGFFLECMTDTLTCAPRRTVAVGEACRGAESVDCPIHASCGSSGLCEAFADVGEPCDRSCAWRSSSSRPRRHRPVRPPTPRGRRLRRLHGLRSDRADPVQARELFVTG
jgi:hypothetical protein